MSFFVTNNPKCRRGRPAGGVRGSSGGRCQGDFGRECSSADEAARRTQRLPRQLIAMRSTLVPLYPPVAHLRRRWETPARVASTAGALRSGLSTTAGCCCATQTQRRWLTAGRGRRGGGRKLERTVVNRETVEQRETVASASIVRRDHPWREEALWQILRSRDRSLSLWLDSVQDPHNLGACLRTADAAGCCAVVIPSRGAVGLTETVRSVACGAALAVPLIQVGSMAAAMKRFHDEFGVHFVGTSDKACRTLFDTDLATHDHVAVV